MLGDTCTVKEVASHARCNDNPDGGEARQPDEQC